MRELEMIEDFMNSIRAQRETMNKDRAFIANKIEHDMREIKALMSQHKELSEKLKETTNTINNLAAQLVITSVLFKEMLTAIGE